MGTALTGLEIRDTYDALIKVTDNGPLDGTLQTLTDGLGNDSALALSTAGASVTGTFAVSGNATFDTSTLVVDAANNRVGILTASPTEPLHVEGNIMLAYGSSLKAANATYKTLIETGYNGSSDFVSLYTAGNNAANATAKITMLASGNVGIGTSSPDSKLHVAAGNIRLGVALDNAVYYVGKATAGTQTFRGAVGFPSTTVLDDISFITHESGAFAGEVARFTGTQYLRFASGTGGIQFNGDTAAANALDDYEEGTWTATATPQTSGSITLSSNGGTYTKVGRQVTCTVFCNISSVSSPVGSYVQFGGLPFTSSSSPAARASVSLYFADASTGYTPYVLPSYIPIGLTVFYVFIDASTLASGDEFNAQITYIV